MESLSIFVLFWGTIPSYALGSRLCILGSHWSSQESHPSGFWDQMRCQISNPGQPPAKQVSHSLNYYSGSSKIVFIFEKNYIENKIILYFIPEKIHSFIVSSNTYWTLDIFILMNVFKCFSKFSWNSRFIVGIYSLTKNYHVNYLNSYSLLKI